MNNNFAWYRRITLGISILIGIILIIVGVLLGKTVGAILIGTGILYMAFFIYFTVLGVLRK